MKLLAIDTSGNAISVCLATEDKIIAEILLNYKQTHSTTLMPIISQIMFMCEEDIENIDFIAITNGPGSFTGLRIGVATAKAIGFSLNKNIISVSTLEALAYNIPITSKHIVPLIDARGERVFSKIYKWNNSELTSVSEDIALSIHEFLEYISKNKIDPIFLGDGAFAYKDIIKSFNNNFKFVSLNHNIQRASSLASLAFEYVKKSKFTKYKDLEIEYFRKSQAERNLLERE